MVFSRRMAALAAVVLIPLGIAATSFALADNPESPKVPSRVELDSGSPTATATGTPAATATGPGPTPGDEVVSRPPVTDSPAGDDDDDDRSGPAATPGAEDDDADADADDGSGADG
ncbi:hypothetical protein SUDANB58_01468 [Streptomyces sp. enrichment culture]|uniref:small secreted hydrophilic protein n=1 Tax=Streptomyces sp. enrichment culture TaxID=1795815 RepID=UPI003F57603D